MLNWLYEKEIGSLRWPARNAHVRAVALSKTEYSHLQRSAYCGIWVWHCWRAEKNLSIFRSPLQVLDQVGFGGSCDLGEDVLELLYCGAQVFCLVVDGGQSRRVDRSFGFLFQLKGEVFDSWAAKGAGCRFHGVGGAIEVSPVFTGAGGLEIAELFSEVILTVTE